MANEIELIEFLASYDGNGIIEDGKGEDEDGNDQ